MVELGMTISQLRISLSTCFEQDPGPSMKGKTKKNEQEDKIPLYPSSPRMVSRLGRPTFARQRGLRGPFGLVDYITANEDDRTMTSVSLRLPAWLCARRYDICLQKSYQGWNQSFRSYRTVSFGAPVLQYSASGDVAGLQRLFKDGASSPFEIDPDGMTPLHVRL
jgi:hypothetical protein